MITLARWLYNCKDSSKSPKALCVITDTRPYTLPKLNDETSSCQTTEKCTNKIVYYNNYYFFGRENKTEGDRVEVKQHGSFTLWKH